MRLWTCVGIISFVTDLWQVLHIHRLFCVTFFNNFLFIPGLIKHKENIKTLSIFKFVTNIADIIRLFSISWWICLLNNLTGFWNQNWWFNHNTIFNLMKSLISIPFLFSRIVSILFFAVLCNTSWDSSWFFPYFIF